MNSQQEQLFSLGKFTQGTRTRARGNQTEGLPLFTGKPDTVYLPDPDDAPMRQRLDLRTGNAPKPTAEEVKQWRHD